jgi:hypothetical protein
MSSVVFICNLALTNLAKPTIVSIDEASAEAAACKQYYAHVRDVMLQTYPWRFAAKTEALAELTNAKEGRWGYAYQRPSDCLKVRRVSDQALADYLPSDGSLIVAGGYAHAIEGDVIYCDVSPAYLTYTYRLTDPTKFSPAFTEALGWHLAVRLAMPLTRDPKMRADAYNLAVRMTATAAAADAQEVRETSDSPSEFIEARGDSGVTYDRYGRVING